MTVVIERIRVGAEFSTLSLMLWRRFNQPMPGLLEDTLKRNPGLERLGHFLPVGTVFEIGVQTTESQSEPSREAIRLW